MSGGPLSGLRVVEFGRLLAGPLRAARCSATSAPR